MNTKILTLYLATALLLCSAFFLPVATASAMTGIPIEKGIGWQADDSPVTPQPSAPEDTTPPAVDPANTPLPSPQADEAPVTPPPSVPDTTLTPAPVFADAPIAPTQTDEAAVTPPPSSPEFAETPAAAPAVAPLTPPQLLAQADDAPVPPPSAPEPPASTPPSSFSPSGASPHHGFPPFTPPTTPPASPPSAPPSSSHHHNPWVSPYPHFPNYPYYNNYPYYSDPYVWPYPYARWSPYVNTYPAVIAEVPQPVYAPVISSFTANPSYIQPGQSALLTWTVNDAGNVTISPNVGSVPNTGVYTVMPAYTTTYTLTASGTGGSVTAGTTVTVAQYYSTYNTGGSVSPAATGNTAPTGTSGIVTSGVSAAGSPALNLWLLYALMIGLLAVAAGVIITLMVRKPAKAYIGTNTGTRAAYLSSSTAPAATLAASGIPMTTPLAAEPSAKFTSEDGKEISLNAAGQSLGRSDLHGLTAPGKADLLSRRHFSLSHQKGDYYIEDRGSTNGTSLNGSDIRGKGRQLLKDGDKIELAGALTITFKS